MKKMSILITGLLLTGCSSASDTEEIDLSNRSWEDITEAAAGETVRLYMWGGDTGINSYIDEYAIPALKEEYDVTLERVPLDTNEIIQKLETEKRADQNEGTIDLIWMNGENFKRAKEGDLLFGPFVEEIPSYQEYYQAEDYAYDFGTATEGYEAPWGKVQFVFQYDSAVVDTPPSTLDELADWVAENPGRFTYPEASDFTGNAFIRHVMLGKAAEADELLGEPYEPLEEEQSAAMWDFLNQLEPDLWRGGETYPASLEELDRLYSQGEVWITMGYNEARAESLVRDGIFPETTESFVLEDPGSIGNTHFLSIPYNSPNKEAAMAAIDFFLSPDAQLEKLKPDYWGESTPLDQASLSEEQRAAFDELDRGQTVPDAEKLADTYISEVDAGYVEWIETEWRNEVAAD
ncbi:ABC transporter substrate-binding protein [Jeotgalibacillus terrae]|uniref:ABC transporter substrate-binding protein n=1 Tax=Jeotgalibacillus terrae TaxID=587735 RepID=A0ABW5ZDL9_9BACL|nr:ABC transporter substrate-binding protein [Jeotgalibacillus terrae]MBM7579479.1 putative spermidine/putrescine transport system substrate-binding protein [Jeotgalibacillus terrae]